MWEQSPLKHAENAKTPTLFIHSDQDYRCPLEQGLQMYSKLKLNGVETKMFVFHDETHELSRSGKPKGRIKRLTEIKKWFDQHLK
jgi:dipeptidyl aminopeptidase/acylaminoacyl peptidase